MERFGRLCGRVLRCMEKDLSVTFADLLVNSVCFASAKFLCNRPWLKDERTYLQDFNSYKRNNYKSKWTCIDKS